MSEYKVIFHVDEMEKWKLVLANTRNLINAFQDSNVIVEVLANSDAVQFLVTTNQNEDTLKVLKDLSNTVHFAVCNNSLRSLGLTPGNLLSFVTIVPSGVAELTIKQHDGYAYIKP